MRLLNLANGEFQVYSWKDNSFMIYFKKFNGHYTYKRIDNEKDLDEHIKAWTKLKYIDRIYDQ